MRRPIVWLPVASVAFVLVVAACNSATPTTTTQVAPASTTTAVNPLADEVLALSEQRNALLGEVASLEETIAARDAYLARVSEDRDAYRDEARDLRRRVNALEATTTTGATTTTEGTPPQEQRKPDGIYRVGLQIAPGIWRSTGSGDECYWERRDENQEIIDNHFGLAGGSVKLRASDFEFEAQDCGSWLYEG
jgi:hypothetical protein